MDLSEHHHALLAKHHVKMLNAVNMLIVKLTDLKLIAFVMKDGLTIQAIFLLVALI